MDKTSEQAHLTQLSWLCPLKNVENQVLAGFAGFAAKATKPIELDSLRFLEPQLTQVRWVQESSLYSLAGFIKKLYFSWIRLNT